MASRAVKIKNLTKKYGDDFYPDMTGVVALEESKTLSWLADKYGFSRQNAHVLFRSLFNFSYSGLVEKRTRRRDERECRIKRDPAERLKRSKGNKYTPVKAAVFKLLERRGAKVEPMHRFSQADFICNGYSVRVLVATTTFKGHGLPKGKRYYHFEPRWRLKKKKCDFYVLYIAETKCFFVVPKEEMRDTAYVPEQRPALLTRGGRYYKYINQWGLLLDKRKELTNELDTNVVI